MAKKNETSLINAMLLIIIIIIFAYVIQGLNYLFELINQYKLLLIVFLIIVVGVIFGYKKYYSNTISKKSSYIGENIINVTPYNKENIIDVTSTEIRDENNNSHNLLESDNIYKKSNKIPDNEKIKPLKQTLEPSLESNVDDDFQNLIKILESDRISFNKNHKDKKEKYYQDELFQQLRQRVDPKLLDYEAANGKHRLDILFNNAIGIELKVYSGKTTMQQLRNQIVDYHEMYDKIIGLVVNPTPENNDIIRKDIEKYVSIAKAIKESDYKIIVK